MKFSVKTKTILIILGLIFVIIPISNIFNTDENKEDEMTPHPASYVYRDVYAVCKYFTEEFKVDQIDTIGCETMGNGHFHIRGLPCAPFDTSTTRARLNLGFNNPYYEESGPPVSYEIKCTIRYNNWNDQNGYVELFVLRDDGKTWQSIFYRTNLASESHGGPYTWSVSYPSNSPDFYRDDGTMSFKIVGQSVTDAWGEKPSCRVDMMDLRVQLKYDQNDIRPVGEVYTVCKRYTPLLVVETDASGCDNIGNGMFHIRAIGTTMAELDFGFNNPLSSLPLSYTVKCTIRYNNWNDIDGGVILFVEDDDGDLFPIWWQDGLATNGNVLWDVSVLLSNFYYRQDGSTNFVVIGYSVAGVGLPSVRVNVWDLRVHLNYAPSAEANGPYYCNEGTPVILDATGSSDLTGDTLNYRWDFNNDGIWDTPFSTDPTISHTWYDDYFGIIKVQVFDGIYWDIDTANINVYNVAPDVDPLSDQTVYEDIPITFTGFFTDPGELDTHTILWDFGDGGTAENTLNPTHTYSRPGQYTVTLTVKDDDGGIGTATCTITVLDITPPTTILEFSGSYQILDKNYISSTATEIVLSAEDAEMPDGSGILRTEYQLDSVTGDWITYTAPFTVDIIGTHIIYYRSIDNAGNVETEKSVEVVVNAVNLTYIGEFSGFYSDPISLEATLIDIATQEPISDKTIVFTIGEQTVSAVTDSFGVASTTLILDQPGGLYIVSASFAGDEMYLPDSDSHDFTIEKEYAYLSYTGSTVVPTTVDTLTLRATVFDEDDGNWGDLSKIHVTFTIYSENYEIVGTYSQWVEFTGTDGVGVAIKEIVYSLDEGVYLVQISLNPDENDYYQGDPSDYVALIIYEPTGDFVTGGGWIEDTNGNKGNFGFNVKYKKNGLPKGQAIYVYREDEYVFIVKANAWLGMAIDKENNYSIFEARCNLKKIDSITGAIVWEEGNYRLTIEVKDNSKDGKNDVFQLRVHDKIGLIFHEAGYDPYGILQGGNIIIHIDD
ncbi:MAG: PKD domain-containing protein [Promethearchaeota archaeon]